MISVVTVCTNNFPMGDVYVRNLRDALRKHLKKPFLMWCITDKPQSFGEGITTVLQDRPVWGWWNLMEIFRGNAPWSDDHVLMVGLDTVITGDVSFLTKPKVPTFLKPFCDQYGYSGPYRGCYADGAVFLPATNHLTWLYDRYRVEVTPEETYRRQRTWGMDLHNTALLKEAGVVPSLWQDVYPDKICSFKKPSPKRKQPPEPLVLFHGSPRPHEAAESVAWIRNHWNKSA